MQKAILYCRVSTREQAETGHSLEAQQSLLEQYAASKGFVIAATIAVPESASGARERLHFAEMLARVRREKIEHIIVEKVDRMSRNPKDAMKLQDWIDKDASHRAHFVKDNLMLGKTSHSSDTFKWDILLSMAKLYSRNLSEEVKKGQAIAAEKGLLPCAYKIGYTSPSVHGGKAQGMPKKPDPAHVPVIKEIFARLANGVPTSDVMRWAKQDGRLLNTSGKPLTKSRFYLFIRDPFVCGQFVFKGKLFEGKHKPIISKALFYTVQDILDARRIRKSRNYFYQFSGLAVDAKSNPLRCSNSKGINYYNSASKQPMMGRAQYLPEAVLDDAVARWFSNVSITNKGIEEFKKGAQSYIAIFENQRRDAKFNADRALETLAERTKKAHIKMLDGKISDAEYRDILGFIEKDKQAILRKMPTEQALKIKDLEPMLHVLKTLKNLRKIYPRLAAQEKASFARMFLLELRVTEDDIHIQGKKEIQALLNMPKQHLGWQDWDGFGIFAEFNLQRFYKSDNIKV